MKEMISESEPIVVLITAASSEEATRIADMLVGRRLAACVQVLPEMKSTYFWKGEVQRESEVLMVVKTTRANFGNLEREVRAMHSYQTPEIVALSIIAGSEDYLGWLVASCAGS
jgi:periplasmic divalent cation tolerance protein